MIRILSILSLLVAIMCGSAAGASAQTVVPCTGGPIVGALNVQVLYDLDAQTCVIQGNFFVPVNYIRIAGNTTGPAPHSLVPQTTENGVDDFGALGTILSMASTDPAATVPTGNCGPLALVLFCLTSGSDGIFTATAEFAIRDLRITINLNYTVAGLAVTAFNSASVTITSTLPGGPTSEQRSQTIASLQNSFNSATPSVLGTDGLGLNGPGGTGGNGVNFMPAGLSYNRSGIDHANPMDRDYGPAFGPRGYFDGGQKRRAGSGFNFFIDLQQMAHAANSKNAEASDAAGLANMSSTSPKDGRTNSRWVTSISGRYVEFDDGQAGADRDGSLWYVTSALGYRHSERTVFGVFSRFREGEVSSVALASTLESSLYGGGVYLASTSASGARLVGSALYEAGDNDITISGAAGSFDSETVTLEASLDKRITRGRVWIEPQLRLLYHESDNDDFTDSAGNFVLGDTQTLGRVSFGPRVGTSLGGNGRAELKPFAKVQGVWDFEREDDVTATTGALLKTGEIALNLGGGLDVSLVNGLALRIAGDWFTYDTELQGWSISGGVGGSFAAFGLASVAPGYVSLDFAANAGGGSAMGRIRIPLGGAK